MKGRFIIFLFVFLAGLAAGSLLYYLDRQADIVSVERSEIFQVTFPDGSYQHLSYAEVERQRAELQQLRGRVAQLQKQCASAWVSSELQEPPPPPSEAAQVPAVPDESVSQAHDVAEVPGESASQTREESKKKLGELFAKIFSKPVMEEIVQSQVQRQVGEVSAVLALSEGQRRTLEERLKKRRLARLQDRQGPAGGRASGSGASEENLEDMYRDILTPGQYRRYEEYQEKKKEMAGGPAVERELFELTWRLGMTPEQETKALELLKKQQEELKQLSPSGSGGDEALPTEQLSKYLEQRKAVASETAEAMQAFLSEPQYRGYLQYLDEKDMETRLLEKMIKKESPPAEEAATP